MDANACECPRQRSERLEEVDERPLVFVAQLRLAAERLLIGAQALLLVEFLGAEIVAAIDDEVGAFVQLQ